MRSMTGYGKGTASRGGLTVTAEIKTVNHKFFDWSIKMPKGFLFVEDDAKRAVAARIQRGHVDVYLTVERDAGLADDYAVDGNLALKYVRTAKNLAETTGVDYDVTVTSLMKNPDIVSLKAEEVDDETAKEVVLAAIDEALVGLVAMREKEGLTQVGDLTAKLDSVESYLKEIAQFAPLVVADYRAKLAARIREALGEALPDEGRIAAEVAIFADKCAIDEEITRLTAHIAAMRAHLKSREPVGRKLDFLVQEMNREANTIGSKANDLRITERVLAIKNEIEKIREQAQNVE